MASNAGDVRLGEQLRTAREEVSLSPSQAAEGLGVDVNDLLEWEANNSIPDGEMLWELAELYGRSVSAFFSTVVTGPPKQDFRKPADRARLDPASARVANALFAELCRARNVLERRHESERGETIKHLRDMARGIESPEVLANRVREIAALGNDPITDIRELLEDWGVMVFLVNMPSPSLSGTSWWHPDWGPAALINRSDSSGRRIFTIAHELAHLLRLDVQPLCDLSDDTAEEKFANRFASALLMPEDDVNEFAEDLVASGELRGEGTDKKTIAKLARRYGTGLQAMSYRLEDLEFLPRGFTNSNAEVLKDYFHSSHGKLWKRAVRDLGSKYTDEIRRAYMAGEMSLSAVADLLNVGPDQAFEWLQEAEPQTRSR